MTSMTINQKGGLRGLSWLGVLLALGVPAALVTLTHSGWVHPSEMERRMAVWIAFWALVLVLFLISLRGEKRPLSSLGLGRFSLGSLGFGLLAGLLAILAFPACYTVLKLAGVQTQAATTTATALIGLPLWARLLTLVTAGVCEEVLYRGYPITRLQALTGSRALAVLIPGILFVALHAPSWGVAHLLYVSVVTVIMTVLFLWRKDLWSNIIAHLLTDAVPLLLMPMITVRLPPH